MAQDGNSRCFLPVWIGTDRSIFRSGCVYAAFDDYHSGGKTYIDAVSYSGMRKEALGDFWTINPMKNQDVIVCGEVASEICDAYTITDLQKEFQKSGTVCSMSDNTDVPMLKHYKVVCK